MATDDGISDQGGTPVYLATRQPPSAEARDEAVVLSVTVAAPALPDHVGQIEVELPIEFAKHAIVQLREAVAQALKNRGN
jgi:hypothetical protein